jgi:hypothetical protein
LASFCLAVVFSPQTPLLFFLFLLLTFLPLPLLLCVKQLPQALLSIGLLLLQQRQLVFDRGVLTLYALRSQRDRPAFFFQGLGAAQLLQATCDMARHPPIIRCLTR